MKQLLRHPPRKRENSQRGQIVADRFELHAPVPTQNTHREVPGSFRSDNGPRTGTVQDVHISRVGFHCGDGVPKPVDHEAEN